MWNKGFFIGGINESGGVCPPGSNEGNVIIKGNDVMVSMPLEFYMDDDGDVYVGGENNNSILIYWSENDMYARKVV